jgi:hypothetical protein
VLPTASRRNNGALVMLGISSSKIPSEQGARLTPRPQFLVPIWQQRRRCPAQRLVFRAGAQAAVVFEKSSAAEGLRVPQSQHRTFD